MKCTVEVKEVWSRTFTIEIPDAESGVIPLKGRALADHCRNEANKLIEEGDNEDENWEYSHTLDTDKWTVRTEKGDFLP